MRTLLFVFGMLVAVYTLSSCKGNDPEEPTGDGFNKEAMLENIGNNVIVASYQALQNQLTEVETLMTQFEQSANETNLNALRESMNTAHALWQHCSPFEFGPAMDANLRLTLNTFPTDTARINQNIKNENYTLSESADAVAKGFPAMEYLLYSSENTQTSIEFLQTAWPYFQANFDLIKAKVESVLENWNSVYLNEFKTNTSSSVGSSLGLLVNQISYDFELTKNAKIGIPLGKKTLGEPQPYQVESPFAKHSITLIKANIKGLHDAFTGGDGKGLDDYLDALGAKYNQNNLSTEINDGFAEVNAVLALIDDDLAKEINNNSSELEDLYAAIQNLIVLLKVDMPSQLGVQITYQDNDGD